MKKKGFTLTELLAVIAILAILILLAIPYVIGLFNDGTLKAMKNQEDHVVDASNLYLLDYCIEKIDGTYECPSTYSKSLNNKTYVCLSDIQKKGYIEKVSYRSSECEGMVVYDADGNTKSGKAYLYCGKDNSGNYAYVTDNSVDIKSNCLTSNDVSTFLTGQEVNVKMKILSGSTNADYLTDNTNITAIVKSNNAPGSEVRKEIASVSTAATPIYMWFDNGTIYYYSEASTIYLNEDSSYMFVYLNGLNNLSALPDFNTSLVTNMRSMFGACGSLTSLNLSSFNTSNVTTMRTMFSESNSLTSLDLSSFDTRKVTDMTAMFQLCSSLRTVNLSSFNTSNVTSMANMFFNATSLTTLNLSNFNTSNVTDMSGMFGAKNVDMSLSTLNISSFNTLNVKDMSGMFQGCTSITTLDLSNFNTSNVTKMQATFNRCSSLTSLDLSNFDMHLVSNTIDMLNNMTALTSLKTPKVYPTSASVVITLPKTMYDTSNNSYTTLNNASPTEYTLSSEINN